MYLVNGTHSVVILAWTLAQAKVACRQLRRNSIGIIIISIIVIIIQKLLGARNISDSSNNSTPVHNAYFKCNGTERNLKYCPVTYVV